MSEERDKRLENLVRYMRQHALILDEGVTADDIKSLLSDHRMAAFMWAGLEEARAEASQCAVWRARFVAVSDAMGDRDPALPAWRSSHDLPERVASLRAALEEAREHVQHWRGLAEASIKRAEKAEAALEEARRERDAMVEEAADEQTRSIKAALMDALHDHALAEAQLVDLFSMTPCPECGRGPTRGRYGCDLKAAEQEAARLREVVRRLLLSADASWEGRGLGHDWDQTLREARAALAPEPEHAFEPCREGDAGDDPAHNFTCALLCVTCGLPREKHEATR